MITNIQNLRWKYYQLKRKKLILYGLKKGLITPYNDSLIEKLRTIYYGGIPASIILLSNSLSNGFCYDRATLLSEAFLDKDEEINLIYASIDSLRLDPTLDHNNPLYDDHCVVERITSNGRHLIYDTSTGLIFDKDIYWLIEHPKIRKINHKEDIKNFLATDERSDPERDKYVSPLVIPFIESTYNKPYEIYATLGIELLQREINYFKEKIDYDNLCKQISSDIEGLKQKRS